MHQFSDLLEFYGILHKIIRGWPATYQDATSQETRSQRINTFGIVRSLADFDADNLKKTVEYTSRALFFSRPWHDSQYQPNALRVEYPALAVREDQFTINDPLNGYAKDKKTLHSLTFLLVDQLAYKENTSIDPISSARRIEEVGNDVRVRMSQLLGVLGRWVFATGYKNGTESFSGWYDRRQLDNLVTLTTIDKYIVGDEITNYITNVSPANAEVFYEIGSDNLVVCSVTLTLETSGCFDLPFITYDAPRNEQPPVELSELEFPK